MYSYEELMRAIELYIHDDGTSASLCRAVEAMSHCNWDSVARIESKPDSGDIPDASRAALSAIWTYATGERSPELALPSLVNRLVTLLAGAAQSVRDFLCFSLALAAFGFGIAALGDADTGRRILLAISNDGSRSRSPLFCGIVDAELVGLQAARGDLTSATFWLARTQRFAQKHDCSLLLSRGMEAIEHPSIQEGGQ